MRFFLSCFLAVLCSGCWNSQAGKRFVQVDRRNAVSEVAIPVDLWDLVEAVYTGEQDLTRSSDHEEFKPDETVYKIERKKSKVQTPLKFTSFKIFLTESHFGVLGGKDYEITYGLGGGDFDFADYVRSQEGSFNMRFEIGMNPKEAEEFHVFYWSNGKRRRIGGDVYGSRCDYVLDLTHFFETQALKSGVFVTTHAKKYVTTLAGTYVFVVKKEGALYIAQLTMKDSRYGLFHCRNNSKEAA